MIGRPPPYPGYISDSEVKVHKDLDSGSHVYHLKVLNSEDEDKVIAYAKHEICPSGRADLEELSKPVDAADKTVDAYGLLREAAHEYFCRCNREMGKYPHILLALLVTSPQHRGQGAGTLVVELGIEKALEMEIPVYL